MKDFLDNKTGDSFIPEEFKVESLINKASDKINEIVSRINNVPPDQHHAYNLEIPGIRRGRNLQTKEDQVNAFKKQIEILEAQTEKQVNKLIENSTPEVRQKGFEKLDQFKNPDKSAKEPFVRKKDHVSRSQDRANDLVVEHQQANREKTQSKEPQKQEPSAEKKETPEMSMSMQFTASLGYTKMKAEKTDKDVKTDKGREIDRDRD